MKLRYLERLFIAKLRRMPAGVGALRFRPVREGNGSLLIVIPAKHPELKGVEIRIQSERIAFWFPERLELTFDYVALWWGVASGKRRKQRVAHEAAHQLRQILCDEFVIGVNDKTGSYLRPVEGSLSVDKTALATDLSVFGQDVVITEFLWSGPYWTNAGK